MDLELDKLNKEQKEAVLHKDGPILVIAGAGTGKTTVITKRIARLIKEKLANPEEILALTFTDKAANEMEERVDRFLETGYIDLQISTFHAFAEEILKENGLDIGLPTDFRLLEPSTAWRLIRQNLNKFSLNYYAPLGNPTRFINAMISHFSRCKDQGIYPEDYLKFSESLKTNLTDLPESKETEKIKEIANAYYIYQRLLLENNYLDFGDLIAYSLKLFKERPNVLKKFRKKFKYILVDEFQDTNLIQYELVKILSGPKNNLMVTADDDQSIYKFRGASYNNIIQFRKDFPKLKEISLIKNYRSSQNILDLAHKFIKENNPNRLEYISGLNKKLEAKTSEKGIIKHLHFKTIEEESRGVANKIIEILENDKKATLNDFAILVRANDSANSFTRALESANIPYQFLASRGLYTKPVILDIISYFKILKNSFDDTAFYRILNIPFLNIPPEEIMKITHYSKKHTKTIYETLQNLPLINNISQKTTSKLNFLLGIIKTHANLAKEKNVSEVLINFLADSGYSKLLSQDEHNYNFDLINQFYKKIKKFEETAIEPSLNNFLDEITIEIESGEQGKLEFNQESGPEIVKVMTIHSAKGLEFKYVFLVNMVDKKFPAINRREAIEIPEKLIKEIIPEGDVHIQEERRLCYVAMTRAKRGLFFTSAEDYGGIRKKKISQFLVEMGFSNDNSNYENIEPISSPTKSLKNKNTEKFVLPKTFSYSQLTAFKSCPLQYKFAYLLKIPVKGKGNFSFGKTIHNTLHKFLKTYLEKEKSEQKNLFSKPETKKKENIINLKELLETYDKEWIDAWYEDKTQKEKYYKKGKKVLKDFYEKFLKDNPKIFKINGEFALEIPFRLKIGDDILFGVIDRIDDLGDGAKIIDYKTGNIKEKLNQDNKRQLLIYQIAVEKVFKIKPSVLTYYFLEENKEVSFIGTEKEKEKEINLISEEINKIKKSDFQPTPGWQCKFCDFKNICPYAKN